jgi:hypothetical protein
MSRRSQEGLTTFVLLTETLVAQQEEPTLEQAMNTQKMSRGTALLFL